MSTGKCYCQLPLDITCVGNQNFLASVLTLRVNVEWGSYRYFLPTLFCIKCDLDPVQSPVTYHHVHAVRRQVGATHVYHIHGDVGYREIPLYTSVILL